MGNNIISVQWKQVALWCYVPWPQGDPSHVSPGLCSAGHWKGPSTDLWKSLSAVLSFPLLCPMSSRHAGLTDPLLCLLNSGSALCSVWTLCLHSVLLETLSDSKLRKSCVISLHCLVSSTCKLVLCGWLIYFFGWLLCYSGVLGTESRDLCIPIIDSTTELHPSPTNLFYVFCLFGDSFRWQENPVPWIHFGYKQSA